MDRRCAQAAIFLFLLLILGPTAWAHPIPDIPVRTHFPQDGTMRVTVEVDPRCFEADPNTAPSLVPAGLNALTPAAQAELQKKAAAYTQQFIEFTLEPVGQVRPEFTFRFTGHREGALQGAEDPVVLTGEWKTTLASGLSGWRIRSKPESKLSVLFENYIGGKMHERIAVLFPGEQSFALDLATLATSQAAPAGERVSAQGSAGDRWNTFVASLREGFVHVVPLGLDHILFVLGLFLLSRSWRPLLAQVTTFTLAHSVTLGLAAIGMVKVSPKIVEPIIAGSIAVVALENIFRPRYTHWRLVVVFVFGLIHGLGFASAFGDIEMGGSFAVRLVGFNLGVEGGQLAVIGLALLATVWLRNPGQYRRWVVVPASLLIAACGAWWMVERLFFSPA